MPLPDFADEAEFREKLIGPLLQKMGYLLVTHSHGTDEQGKDFFFADFDKFEHVRYYAIQAKKGNIGAGDTELDKLLNQVKRSFTVRIRHRKGAEEQRISAVYIFASGKISSEAREYISEHCRAEHYGENVYYLDGDRLERLEKYFPYQSDKDMQKAVFTLYFEAVFNLHVLKMAETAINNKQPFYLRCKTSAMDAFLSGASIEEFIKHQENPDLIEKEGVYLKIAGAWIFTSMFNKISDHIVPFLMMGSQINDAEYQTVIDAYENCVEATNDLKDRALHTATELGKKYQLEIEIATD